MTPAAGFQKLYKGLNAGQRAAVDAIEGPVMVVAGPGTGKTHVLTLRIANILQKTDTPPDGILALTFTEAAAANMRRRLAGIIGAPAYRVRIHTFHGYCQDVIGRYPDEFPRIVGSEPVSDVERIDIMRGIIEAGSWEHIRTFGSTFFFLPEILKAISDLKRENVSPAQFDAFVDAEEKRFRDLPDLYHEKGKYAGTMKGEYQRTEKLLARTKELARAFELYEAGLRERRKYDFEDMIVEVVAALKGNANLRLVLQEESLYILADEHQDANAAQNSLLELLSGFHDEPNLFVVGDEKQAIYRFQGASLENFNYFKRLFPNAQLVTLTESYRSGQAILDASHALVSATGSYAALVSKADVTSAIELREFATPAMERAWIAKDIQRLVGEGVEPSDIAVLFRTNREAETIRQILAGYDVAASVESGENALHDPEIRRLLTLIHAVARCGESSAIVPALHLNFLVDNPIDAYKAIKYASRRDLAIAEVLADKGDLLAAGVRSEALHELGKNLIRWAKGEGSVPRMVERMIRESGFLSYALASEHPIELLEKLGWLMRDIETLAAGKPDYSLAQLADDFDLLEEHGVSVSREKRAAPRPGAVRLMTAHRAKGLEFEHVYVMNAADGVWGGRADRRFFLLPAGGATGGDEDERRLLYVALTRGKLSVAVSYARENENGRDRLKSRLLEDIRPELMDAVSTDAFSAAYRPLEAIQAPVTIKEAEADYVRQLFEEQGLSVTALNNYLSCPWEYFYNNLVRIPAMPEKHLLFGTAAHATLNRLIAVRAEGKSVTSKQLIAWFVEAAARLPLSRRELEDVIARGEKFLTGWYELQKELLPKTAKTEYKIQAELPLPESRTVLLRGTLDRLDLDGEKAHVVDYKTGAPKTRNAILGKTQDDVGPAYFRQLVFYRLLLELDGRYRFAGATLDFLQPDDRDKYHREDFEITEQDVIALKAEIARVAGEIRSLSFWQSRCGEADCEYCALRDLMNGTVAAA